MNFKNFLNLIYNDNEVFYEICFNGDIAAYIIRRLGF